MHTSLLLERTQPAQFSWPKKAALICKDCLQRFTPLISSIPLILCLWMFFFSEESFWQLRSGEEGKFSHPVLGIEELLVSPECLWDAMASLSQLVIAAVFIPSYSLYLLSHPFSLLVSPSPLCLLTSCTAHTWIEMIRQHSLGWR